MRFFVIAVSYKHGGICVAGINYDTFEYVRLGKAVLGSCDCNPLNIFDITINGQVLSVGDLIEVEAVRLPVNGCQTENYKLIRIVRKIKKLSINEIDNIYCQMVHPEYVFKDINSYISVKDIFDVKVSIGFYKVQGLIIHNQLYNGKNKIKANFRYNNQSYRDISVTDCRICGYPAQFGNTPLTGTYRDAYIAVTLPNDRWAKENGFYKYVSGVMEL